MPSSYTSLYYHLIFSTKERKPLIAAEWQTRLYDYIGGIISHEKGRLLAAGGTTDHVHLLASLTAQQAVSDILRLVKANSSKWVNETFAEQRKFRWQDGYGAFSVSFSNLPQVKRYIAKQQQHHSSVSFQEEFLAFLQRHGVAYDERYIWK